MPLPSKIPSTIFAMIKEMFCKTNGIYTVTVFIIVFLYRKNILLLRDNLALFIVLKLLNKKQLRNVHII